MMIHDPVGIREKLSENPFRPLYHFSPPGFGLHDPTGLCFWEGKYHLFYLLNTPDIQWGRGHAVSDDLVHWQDLPMLPADIKGGTGQVWVENDRVILGLAESIAIASDPMLLNWTRQELPMAGDQCLWGEEDGYYLCRTDTTYGATVLELLHSVDLSTWESLGDFLKDERFTDPGTDCSCPNLLPLGQHSHLLLFFSHNQGPKYYIGTYDKAHKRFRIEKHGRMCFGPVMRGSMHAPAGFVDPGGRCVAIWNIAEGFRDGNPMGLKEGILSLPRQLSENEDSVKSGLDKIELNPLRIEPIEALKALRFDPVTIEDLSIPVHGETILETVQGRSMELDVVIDPKDCSEVGLRVFRSPDGEEQTTIRLLMDAWAWPWTSDKRELMIDVSCASLNPDMASRSPEIGPLYLQAGELLRLRIFLDRSVVEVFANDRQCLTVRAYPSRPDSHGVSVFARGGDAHLVSFHAYQMKSIWPELQNDKDDI